MEIIDEILVKSNDQRDKCYSFTTNYNQELKYFTAVHSCLITPILEVGFSVAIVPGVG